MNEADKNIDAGRATEQTRYGVGCPVTDYILGITFEIWEEGQVDRILDYYSEDCTVFGLDGITEGAARMVDHTRATLSAFPDRLLIGDDVIWSGTTAAGYSSHRVFSPMTNTGDSAFGPATGRRVQIMNIADCEITDGRITREWLVRDNLALVRQLGFETREAASALAERFDARLLGWLGQERARVGDPHAGTTAIPANAEDLGIARRVLQECWQGGDRRHLESAYAPYCSLLRAPVRISSGRDALLAHYDQWRQVIPDAQLSIDHVCGQPFGREGRHLAVRWSLAGSQQADLGGCEARGQPLYILGVTHWRLLAGRIITEWTVFDELAVMAQSLHGGR